MLFLNTFSISCAVVAGSVYQWAGSDSPRSSAASKLIGISVTWLEMLWVIILISLTDILEKSDARSDYPSDAAAAALCGGANLTRKRTGSSRMMAADNKTPQKPSSRMAPETSAAVASIPTE